MMAANLEAHFKEQAEKARAYAAKEGSSPWIVEQATSTAEMFDRCSAMWGELREECEKEIVE